MRVQSRYTFVLVLIKPLMLCVHVLAPSLRQTDATADRLAGQLFADPTAPDDEYEEYQETVKTVQNVHKEPKGNRKQC